MTRVYIPVDINNFKRGNPYPALLLAALESAGCVVDHGLFHLSYNEKKWDIVSVQWPVALSEWREPKPEELNWLDGRLLELSRKAKIVVTIHNETPHYRASQRFASLYNLVFKHASAFVHFGKVSEGILKKRYPDTTCGKVHRIIPHGNYELFGGRISKEAARGDLGLPQRAAIVLVMGSLRGEDEVDLLQESLPYWSGGKTMLLFMAQLPAKPALRYGSFYKRWVSEIRRYRFKNAIRRMPNGIYRPGDVEFGDMAKLLSAVDILLIPRRRTLNSGHVPLGFTYGVIVVGPDTGNIGDMLRNTNNPVFDPDAGASSMSRAIKQGIDLIHSELGESNRQLAVSEWSWQSIGLQYKMLFDDLRNTGLTDK